jgi:hypothetical protein
MSKAEKDKDRTESGKDGAKAGTVKAPRKGNPPRRRLLCKRRRHLGSNVTLTPRIRKRVTRHEAPSKAIGVIGAIAKGDEAMTSNQSNQSSHLNHSIKWAARSDGLGMEEMTNESLTRTTADVGARDGKRRLKSLHKRKREHVAKLKTMYHSVSTTTRRSQLGASLKAKIDQGSVLASLEQRVDVLLFRAGLTTSLAQAHARCSQGHVLRLREGESKAHRWSYPASILPVGACLQRDRETWAKRAPTIKALRWSEVSKDNRSWSEGGSHDGSDVEDDAMSPPPHNASSSRRGSALP